MTVVQVISGLMFGGGQRVALDLLAEMNCAQDLNAHLVLLGDRAALPVPDATLRIGYDGRYNRPGTLAATAYALRGALVKLKTHVVHSHGWDADFISALALSGTRRGHLIHLHVRPDWLHSSRARHRIRRMLSRWMMKRRGTRTIAVSRSVAAHWTTALGLSSRAVPVIHNGVDLDRFCPGSGRRGAGVVIGAAARLSPQKGLDRLIAAFSSLVRGGIDAELRLAGVGSQRTELARQAAREGLENRVKFLGQVIDMTQFYRSLDVFVLASLSEGLPLTVLEAMACGTAVIATDVGGVCEVIAPGHDGLLVEPGNEPALARAMQELLADEARRRRMGLRGREKVAREFSLKAASNGVFEQYRRLGDWSIAGR